MKRDKFNFNIWLFGFYFVHLDDFQANIKNDLPYKLVKILTIIFVGILPYCFSHFTWYKIMVYFVEDYFPLPIHLRKLIEEGNKIDWDWDIRDIYEVHQLDQ